MRKLTYAIASIAFLLAGCSQEESIMENKGEQVTLNYNISLKDGVQSRAGSETTVEVNKLLCAIFENGTELKREVVDVTNGTAEYKPTLFKNIEYHIVFWAYYESDGTSCYDVSNLKNIKINTNYDKDVFANDAKKDAFTAVDVVKVTANPIQASVNLTRPFAQINVYTTETDWNNAVALGGEPKYSKITVSGYANQYNALSEKWSGTSEEDYTFTSTVSKDDNYSLASEYIFANGTAACTIQVFAEGDKEIFTKEITNFPIDANKRTNVTSQNDSGLMTGDVTYSITILPGLNENATNQEIN